MLAPMQGVTNRAVREVFVDLARPGVVFTEFMRVRHGDGGASRLSAAELEDARPVLKSVPVVVQLIGRDRDPLVDAAKQAQDAGAVHLNLNMGCPWGRLNLGCGGAC